MELKKESMIKKPEPKTQIAYIPTHANGDIQHEDVEWGFVTSSRVLNNGKIAVWCRFWLPPDPSWGDWELRTKGCSERCYIEQLEERISAPEDKVNEAWKLWVEQ